MTVDKVEMKHYEALAHAIIVQAVIDYKAVYKILRKNPKDRIAMDQAKHIKRFFHSQWFRALTSVDGEYLIRMVEKEIDEGRERTKGVWKSKGMLYGYGNR